MHIDWLNGSRKMCLKIMEGFSEALGAGILREENANANAYHE